MASAADANGTLPYTSLDQMRDLFAALNLEGIINDHSAFVYSSEPVLQVSVGVRVLKLPGDDVGANIPAP